MNAEAMAEPFDASPTLDWMRSQAQERGCTITGSLAIADGGRRYNRLVWMTPEGGMTHYDKRHLFRMGDEPRHYAAGAQAPVANAAAGACHRESELRDRRQPGGRGW